MVKCKGKTNTGKPCKLEATINGYCFQHWFKVGKSKRQNLIKKINEKINWKN